MMKKLFLALVLLININVFAQQQPADITLCHTPAIEKFALFASNKDFNKKHPDPLPYIHVSQAGGDMTTFTCTDGTPANAYLLKAKTKTNNWIFVFQEWWGLNDHIKREAERLYNDLGNVNVMAIDMYDGKLATTREDAGKFMGEFKPARGTAIVEGALAFVGKEAKVGTIGWCFGGGQSMQAALTAGNQAAACVIYYGMPEENVDRLKKLNCDVLNIWPTKDQWINKDVVTKFEANMKTAGKNLTTKSYEADHAFANPSNPGHNKEFAADAYKNSLDFFKARLK